VTVGNDNALAFSPNSITAAVGSSIEFAFFAPIHSVTQSSFDSPCAPFTNGTGFWSGAITTTGDGSNANVFTLTVNDTNPIWFYCATIGHCESGMAGVINPPSDGSETLDQYKAAASKVSNPPAPSVAQGGSIGPPKAASTGSSTSGSSSTGSSTSGSSTSVSSTSVSSTSVSSTAVSSSSQSATSSTATTTPTKSAGARGVDTKGSALWVPVALAGLVAAGIGSLIL